MANFLDRLAGLQETIVGSTGAKVLGARRDDPSSRPPAVRQGDDDKLEGFGKQLTAEGTEDVAWTYWGAPRPEGGVTILVVHRTFKVLQGDNREAARNAAYRIADWVMDQDQWSKTGSDRDRNSLANEILCHAHSLVNEQDMSLEYMFADTQSIKCGLLGFDLSPGPPVWVDPPNTDGIA